METNIKNLEQKSKIINSEKFVTKEILANDSSTESISQKATTQQEINIENKIYLNKRQEIFKTEFNKILKFANQQINDFSAKQNYSRTKLIEIHNGVSYSGSKTFNLSQPYTNFDVLEFKIWTTTKYLTYFYYYSTNNEDCGVGTPAIICPMNQMGKNLVWYKYTFNSPTKLTWSQLGLSSGTTNQSNRMLTVNGIKYAKKTFASDYIKISNYLSQLIYRHLNNYLDKLSLIHSPNPEVTYSDKEIISTDNLVVTNPIVETNDQKTARQNLINIESVAKIKLQNNYLTNLYSKISFEFNNYLEQLSKSLHETYLRKDIIKINLTNNIEQIIDLGDNKFSKFDFIEVKVSVGTKFQYIWLASFNDNPNNVYNFLMVNNNLSAGQLKINYDGTEIIKAKLSTLNEDLTRTLRLVGITYR